MVWKETVHQIQPTFLITETPANYRLELEAIKPHRLQNKIPQVSPRSRIEDKCAARTRPSESCDTGGSQYNFFLL